MEREKNFYSILVMFLFVTCYTTCYILSNRIIEFGSLIATGGAIIYPFTYFIGILYYEKFGANKTFELINFSIISLIFTGLMISLASTFSVYGDADGLDKLFNIDFRMLFASIVSFITGQYVNIKIYNFLGNKKGFDFLIAGVISITVDSFLFIALSYLGVMPFGDVLKLATGQYALSVVAIIIFALCFNSLIPSLLESKKVKTVSASKSASKKRGRPKKENLK